MIQPGRKMSIEIRQFQSATGKTSRIPFLDNFRSAIIVLVMLHHIAVMYSGSGSFYYIEPGDTLSNDLLGVFTALIVFFRRFINFQGRLSRLLYRHSYTFFIIHAPILTLLAVWLLRGLNIEHLLKFALLAVIAVPLCFTIAYLIRKIPFVSGVV
jgi:peptidoglycan/LPS O-acetylase OafA/YrhL